MKNIILHISDLHISLDKKIGDERINMDSFLQIPNDKVNSEHYIDKFISKVKSSFGKANIYLLITGDITESGGIIEYKYAQEYLNKIIDNLNIKKNNILLVPGDHDINRKEIQNLISSTEEYNIDELNLSKFKNFIDFYKKIIDKEFDPNKIIFDSINFEDKLLLIGLNSSYHIDLEFTEGKVDIRKFKTELSQLSDKPIKRVICCHHNITSLHEDKNSGQWEKENRLHFISALEENDIKYLFSGNEHTNGCKKTIGDTITVSDSGTLSSKKYDSAFKIYELEDNDSEDIVLVNHIFALQKTGQNDEPYYWGERKNSEAKQPEKFEVLINNPPNLDVDVIELPENKTNKVVKEEAKTEEIKPKNNIYSNLKFSKILYDKVKELNLFHSGHFHWSETSRAHNWIDISKLIEKKDNLSFVKNAVIDVIENKKLEDKIDLIIGLGYEGNIISSKAIIKFNKPYAFLPYSYRYDEHHEYENELSFDNTNKKFKNVLIITDVVNDGRTIRKLIKKRQDSFFKNVNKVYVISLFYTGHSKINYNILNYDFVKTIPNYDIENDDEVNNIEYFTVKVLKVEKCPYSDDFRESCLIVKDKLGCVNLFYDESKYL